MKNIFDKLNLQYHYFNVYDNLENDLHHYLYDNLFDENYETFRWDLDIVIKINANEEYI
jgi:hypothetical protein